MGKEFYIEEGFKQSATGRLQQDKSTAEKASQKFLDDFYGCLTRSTDKLAQTKNDFCSGPFTEDQAIILKKKQAAEKKLKDSCAETETSEKGGSWKSEKQLNDFGLKKQTGSIEKQPLDNVQTLLSGSFGGPSERDEIAGSFRKVAEVGGSLDELLDKINRRLVSEGSQYKLRFGQNVIKTPGGRRLELIDRQGHVLDRLDFVVPVPTDWRRQK